MIRYNREGYLLEQQNNYIQTNNGHESGTYFFPYTINKNKWFHINNYYAKYLKFRFNPKNSINTQYTGPKINLALYPNNNISIDVESLDKIKITDNYYNKTNNLSESIGTILKVFDDSTIVKLY